MGVGCSGCSGCIIEDCYAVGLLDEIGAEMNNDYFSSYYDF